MALVSDAMGVKAAVEVMERNGVVPRGARDAKAKAEAIIATPVSPVDVNLAK